MPPFQGDRELAAPRDCPQENGQARHTIATRRRAGQSRQELGNIVEQPPKARRVAARLLIHARTAAIEKVDLVAGASELCAGILVPSRMALNAVDKDHRAARLAT